MSKNYLLIYSEQLATDIELMCQSIKAPSNTFFQIRKSSSSVYANIREANYGQSKADMLSKFEIALKECSETEGWLQLLFNTNGIDEDTHKAIVIVPDEQFSLAIGKGGQNVRLASQVTGWKIDIKDETTAYREEIRFKPNVYTA